MRDTIMSIIAPGKDSGLSGIALFLSIILYPWSVKLALLFLLIHFLVTLRSNYTGFSFRFNSSGWLVVGCIVFYLLHILSLSYSDDLRSGIKDIETKFGFFIFPLLALLFPRTNEQQLHFIRTFIFSFLLASVICIVRSVFFFLGDFDTIHLFYDQFSFLMHPTYFTMYLALALLFHIYLGYAENSLQKHITSNMGFNAVAAVLLAAIFMTSSRAGILISIMAIALMLSGFFLKMKKIPVSVFLTLGVVSMFMLVIMTAGSSRFSILFNELSGKANKAETNTHAAVDENPVAHRFTLLQVAFKVALQNPVGVGVGDVQDILVTEYRKIGYEKAAIVRYNPHNQYLQTAVALGIPGLVSLLIIIIALFFSIKYSGYGKLLFFAGFILALNALFESVFEVQRGVLLITLLIAFLGGFENSGKISDLAK